MGSTVFLLGAGASIDAGLLDANNLTRKIYEKLRAKPNGRDHIFFGFIITRLLERKLKSGGTPYDDLNVEEVYDVIERIVGRHQDIMADFVSSWDPSLGYVDGGFDKKSLKSAFEGAIYSLSPDNFHRDRLRMRSRNVDQFIEEIGNVIRITSAPANMVILNNLIDCLISCLSFDDNSIGYMCDLMQIARTRNAIVTSLNYDLITEKAMADNSIDYDYGLSTWQERRLVEFKRRGPTRLIKLHGSINWYGSGDEISIVDDSKSRFDRPLIIFGGQRGKLRHDGPFLQLRHEFERALLLAQELVVVGYSFGDEHLNAIIRRWVSTRRKAKMIIIDPGNLPIGLGGMKDSYRLNKENKLSHKTVDIIHIKRRASEAIELLTSALNAPIDTSIEDRSGVLPNALVNVLA